MNSNLKIVILAAGTGSRLMPLTRNTPKSLIDLGHGYTLLERQLAAIKECGIKDVALLLGYKAQQIEAKIADISELNFNVIYNPFFNTSNNLVSAWMAFEHLSAPLVLVNGDDVFKPSVLKTLLESPDDLTLMACRKQEYDSDDMKICIQQDLITDIGKLLPADKADGESIGMLLFRDRGYQMMLEKLRAMVRSEENLQKFYLEAIRELARDGERIKAVYCDSSDWAEVDFHPDLSTVRDHLVSALPEWD